MTTNRSSARVSPSRSASSANSATPAWLTNRSSATTTSNRGLVACTTPSWVGGPTFDKPDPPSPGGVVRNQQREITTPHEKPRLVAVAGGAAAEGEHGPVDLPGGQRRGGQGVGPLGAEAVAAGRRATNGPASGPSEEARQMTGGMHIADAQGDTIRTWDTLDPGPCGRSRRSSGRRRRPA